MPSLEFSLRLPVFALLVLAVPGHFLAADTELNIPGHRLTWHDEFEQAVVDATKWDVNVGVNAWYELPDGRSVEPHWFNEDISSAVNSGTINGERQYYSPDNVTIDQGILVIRADEEPVIDPVGLYDPEFHTYTSGKLNTADEFQFTFGIVKWRAKLPSGQGLWPALWMLNSPDPWYWDDEIDVMEARGAEPTVTTSAHHFKNVDGNGNRFNQYNYGTLETGMNLQEGFHEYGLEWRPDTIQTWLDDQTVFFDDIRIPQGSMFLIMNAAVGGGFGGDPDETTVFPTTFEIDWVRVWQVAPTPGDLASGDFEDNQGAQWANWNTRDDGNVAVVNTGALHGPQSVQISRRNEPLPVGEEEAAADPVASNLLTDGTAGPWRGYLNEKSDAETVTGGYEVDPATIPATATADQVTISIQQNAPSPWATAVAFREFSGSSVQGKTLIYTGTVAIEEAFPEGTEATAFIRVFDSGYNTSDVKTSVTAGGQFSLEATIPGFDVPIVHVGIETTGPSDSPGRLAATELAVVEDGGIDPPPPPIQEINGFFQTVIATPGQPVRYGLLAANHPTDPMGSSAAGHLRLEFLDAEENVIDSTETVIVDNTTPTHAVPFSLEAITPPDAAFARLSIDRVVLDPQADLAGTFIADAAFLQIPGSTDLPFFTSAPGPELTVNAGQPVSLDLDIESPTTVTVQWYHLGQPVSTDEDLSFIAQSASAGTYFVVARNDAGPVAGAITELTVLEAATDTDGDLISDEDEINIHNTNPLQADSDRDGIDDYGEIFLSLTDPLDASSRLRIKDFEMFPDQIELTFTSVDGVVYAVKASSNLVTWQTIGDSHTATGAQSTVTATIPAADPVLQFFRIAVVP